MEKLKGYKTLIFSAVVTLSGIALAAGVIPQEANDFITTNLEAVFESSLIVIGFVIGILRKVTTTPIGQKEE